MNVEESGNVKELMVIETGEVFEYDGDYFIKLGSKNLGKESKIEAFKLDNNTRVTFGLHTLVNQKPHKLIIGEE